MAKKLTKRKAFNFLRSYFDLLNELETDADKLQFLLAIINKQFLDENPKGLNFVVNLCYESQRHVVEKSVKGYKDKTKQDLIGNPLQDPYQDPTEGGTQGPTEGPCQQEEEKEKEEEQLIKEIVSPPNGVDPLYFYIAKGYHKMFYDHKGGKTLEQSKLSEWVKTARLLIEADNIEPLHLITIKYFLQSGIDKDKGTDSFWSDTIYSLAALRKKGKDGTYKFDRIKQDAKKWLAKNPDKEPLIYQAYNNLMKKVNGEH